jgi:hypothetical protein
MNILGSEIAQGVIIRGLKIDPQRLVAYILMDAAHVESLHRKLRSLQLGVTPIQDTVVRTIEVVASADGRKRVVSVYRASRADLYIPPEALSKDIGSFFTLPVPKAVWAQVKELQDGKFVAFIEISMR